MRFMKFIRKYPFLFVLLVSTFLLSIIGYVGKNTIYAQYAVKVLKTPQLSVVFQGMGDGVYPWSMADNRSVQASSTDDATTEDVMNDDTGNNTISNNSTNTDMKTGETIDDKGNTTKNDSKIGDSQEESSKKDKTNKDNPSKDNKSKQSNIDKATNDKSKKGKSSKNQSSKKDSDKRVSKEDKNNNKDMTTDKKSIDKNTSGDESDKKVDSNNKDSNASDNSTNPDKSDVKTNQTTDKKDKSNDKTYSFQTVKTDYFDDALFIGDSRTVGLSEYSGWKNPTFCADVGLSIYEVFNKKIAKVDGHSATLKELLTKQKFAKIYIMLGINELGRGTSDSFLAEYSKVVDSIHKMQPDAIVFVEGIMNVSKKKSDTDKIFNNKNIKDRNDHISTLANNKDIFYIDVNDAITDKTGSLPAEYTFDNIHLKAAYYKIWTDFLKQHGVVEK